MLKCRPFTLAEAKRSLRAVGLEGKVSLREWRYGLKVEQEHADVTGCRLMPTARITAVHVREKKTYYKLLRKYVERS